MSDDPRDEPGARSGEPSHLAPFVQAVRPTPNRKAVTALMLGVASLLCLPTVTLVLAPLAIGYGVVARREIDAAEPGRYVNRNMTTIAMALGALALGLSAAWLTYRALR